MVTKREETRIAVLILAALLCVGACSAVESHFFEESGINVLILDDASTVVILYPSYDQHGDVDAAIIYTKPYFTFGEPASSINVVEFGARFTDTSEYILIAGDNTGGTVQRISGMMYDGLYTYSSQWTRGYVNAGGKGFQTWSNQKYIDGEE